MALFDLLWFMVCLLPIYRDVNILIGTIAPQESTEIYKQKTSSANARGNHQGASTIPLFTIVPPDPENTQIYRER
jgi:hypothetical protein